MHAVEDSTRYLRTEAASSKRKYHAAKRQEKHIISLSRFTAILRPRHLDEFRSDIENELESILAHLDNKQ